MRSLSRSLLVLGALTTVGCGSTGGSASATLGDPTTNSGGSSSSTSVNGTTTGGGNGGMKFTPQEDPAKECERVVEFTAVTLSETPPFDVLIVADHSDSLSWSRDDLARGLGSLLDNVRGREVRLFVLTPTQYGASTEAAELWLSGSNLIAWKDPVTGTPYPNAMTEYHVECEDANGESMTCPTERTSITLTAKGHWDFVMPEPVASLRPGMTEAEFAEQQQLLTSAILDLGGGGAQVEQPLCTLNRYVVQNTGNYPANAVFLVLSDEDDTTDGRNCLLGHTTTQTVDGERLTSCTGSCDEYRYRMSRSEPYLGLSFDCVPVDDFGTQHPELAEARGVSVFGIECTPGSVGECSAEVLESAARQCSPGSIPVGCEATCSDNSSQTCTVTRTDTSIDLCTEAFTDNGVSYANLGDFCQRTRGKDDWGDCQVAGYQRTEGTGSLKGSMIPDRIVGGLETSDLIRNFHDRAREIFGADGYKVQSIILDPEFACEPQAGQSYGTNLRELASSDADVFAICESYAGALSSIQGFAASQVRTEYPLALESDEVIESIVISDQQGNQRQAKAEDYDYDPDAGVLSFEPGVLTANDADLDVQVVANCRVPVK